MIIILRNAMAEAKDGCLALEAEHGRWKLCVAERKASLELELSEAELPIDLHVPIHPNAALNVLFDVARSLAEDGWAPGRLKVAVVGPHGSGKSTLVRRLLGLPPPAGPTPKPEAYRAVVLGREAEVVDIPAATRLRRTAQWWWLRWTSTRSRRRCGGRPCWWAPGRIWARRDFLRSTRRR